jgi:hypothetical protein
MKLLKTKPQPKQEEGPVGPSSLGPTRSKQPKLAQRK